MFEEKDNELLSLCGTVEHIIYHNEENGYSVCELSVENEGEVTLVGVMPFLNAGETIKAMGNWTLNPKFGRQFKVEYHEKLLPQSESGILKYLSSGAIHGIGPATARRIVEKFGTESFDVIENDPELLASLPGVSKKKAFDISACFREQHGIRDVMEYCRDFFSPSTAVRIFNRWGSSTIDVIEENPYTLCDEIYGISFEKADRIALSHGVKKDAEIRIMAGIKYLLKYNAQENGHVYIPQNKLISAVAQMFSLEKEFVASMLLQLLSEGELSRVKYAKRNCIYLNEMYAAEVYTAQKLDIIDRRCPVLDAGDIEILISRVELEENITYAPMQKKAIELALRSGVMILTGGPGTGKTTVIKALISIFEEMRLEVALAAPTGRAAKRMTEATGYEAKTIHRLLEMEYAEDNFPKFRKCDEAPLDEDVIIIDEVSMVDTVLMEALLHAIKPGSKLILIGDSDQLPSVGAGNVLNDLIASGAFSTVKLKKIFRQAEESLIVTNAHMINNGEYPELESKRSDFFFMARGEDADIVNTVKELYKTRLPNRYGADIKDKIQVIAPSRKGESGTEVLNAILQRELNPPSKDKAEKKVRDIVFRVGDKVMQVRNNYDIAWESEYKSGIGIFNGDIGVIKHIDHTSESVVVHFDDDKVAVYDFSMLIELEHAYAVTVHKSQGSEYPVVIMPIYSFSRKLLTRNLLYTAVTRARDMVIMVGRPDIVRGMVDNNVETKRYTGLKYLLRNEENTDDEE
ncbi:MAG: ATP-dependent RecD-like DNA helicase [Ruminococcaceae bacterium]|nr:ATP-dependent RecD-like DNA helicase [Oscillospiraceae bacterium]